MSAATPLPKSQFLLLFFLCCTLPLLAAKLALSFGWFTAGATNKGQWLEHEIQLFPASDARWHLVYIQSNRQQDDCNQRCELALYSLQQLYSGLGAHQARVDVRLVAAQKPEQLSQFPSVHWHMDAVVSEALVDQLVIVNPKGVALLSYPVAPDKAQLAVIAKRIRADLLHLLAYDRPHSLAEL